MLKDNPVLGSIRVAVKKLRDMPLKLGYDSPHEYDILPFKPINRLSRSTRSVVRYSFNPISKIVLSDVGTKI